MDVYAAVESYMKRVFSDIAGMKILLVDRETSGMISLVMSQSRLFEQDVFLVDYLENEARQPQQSLGCVCLLRPTSRNFEAIAAEVAEPRYAQYHLFFTNAVKTSFLERVAEADEQEVVKDFQEIFCDYYPLYRSLFTLNEGSLGLFEGRNGNRAFSRVVEGLASLFFSSRQRPSIRYSQRSTNCSFLAKELAAQFDMYSDYFNPRTESRGLLLIMDRADDPVTPLLTQWTYQAAVHETFVLRNGRVRVETPTLNTEIVLSHDQDAFYKENMFEPIWQVGPRVQELVQKYQGMASQGSGFESVADMKRFIEDYPEYRKLGAAIERHTTLLNELMKLSEQSGLRTVSAFEQDLTVSERTADASWAELMPLLARPDLPHYHKLRLCMLVLCHVGLSRPLETLSSLSFSDDDIAFLKYFYLVKSGKDQISGAGGNPSGISATVKSWIGSGNVHPQLRDKTTPLTQHVPKLFEVLDSVIRDKLSDGHFPYLVDSLPIEKPQEIFVFILDGATYEEARFVSYVNEIYPSVKVVLGSNFVHNSRSYIAEVFSEWRWSRVQAAAAE